MKLRSIIFKRYINQTIEYDIAAEGKTVVDLNMLSIFSSRKAVEKVKTVKIFILLLKM